MTPDGISDDDWDRVHEAAVDIVNASAIEDDVLSEHHTERLFDILRELESKYGRIPGILATMGDFTDDPMMAIALHEEALAASGDTYSTMLSLQSLVRLMIDEQMDARLIATRLSELEGVTGPSADPSDRDELLELQRCFGRLKG